MKKLEDLFKVKLDVADPNNMDMELLYQDNLPPETKQLEDFVDNLKEKETNQQKDPEQCIKEANKRLAFFKDEFLPEEGRD